MFDRVKNFIRESWEFAAKIIPDSVKRIARKIVPIKKILNQAATASINCLGFVGILLIVYGVVVTKDPKTQWRVLEDTATTCSNYATLIGTAVTAASIYLPKNDRPPESLSFWLTAPAVIVAVLFTFYYQWSHNSIPPHVINGFSILAIAGALNRLIPEKL
jgi:drug/metabolite transporter (DMT)-like permease